MAGKYRNKKTTIGDETFDSAKEAARWLSLIALQEVGAISQLRRQVRIPAKVAGVKVFTYIADFVYTENGIEIVEDVKSAYTARMPVYRLKKKVLAALGIEIREYGV